MRKSLDVFKIWIIVDNNYDAYWFLIFFTNEIVFDSKLMHGALSKILSRFGKIVTQFGLGFRVFGSVKNMPRREEIVTWFTG